MIHEREKIAVFTYRSPHFCFPWRRPCDYHAIRCMDGTKFNASQTPCSMYLSIFNSFRVIRCWSQCVSPKIAIFLPHFCFPWGRPWGNHAKCCMDGKRIRCWKENSMLTNCFAAGAHLSITVSEIERDICEKKSSFYHTPIAFDAPVRGVPVGMSAPPLVWKKTRTVSLPDGGKILKICLFVLMWSTNVTDGQTDGRTDCIDRACIASRGKNVVCKRKKFVFNTFLNFKPVKRSL